MSLGGLYGGWHMTPPNVLLFCCIAAFNLTIGVKYSCVKMHVLVCAPQHGEAEWDSSAGGRPFGTYSRRTPSLRFARDPLGVGSCHQSPAQPFFRGASYTPGLNVWRVYEPHLEPKDIPASNCFLRRSICSISSRLFNKRRPSSTGE